MLSPKLFRKRPVSPEAMPVEVLAFRCCFRVLSWTRLECSRASRLVFSGASAPARPGQSWPGAAGVRYAAFGRLDLLYIYNIYIYIYIDFDSVFGLFSGTFGWSRAGLQRS